MIVTITKINAGLINVKIVSFFFFAFNFIFHNWTNYENWITQEKNGSTVSMNLVYEFSFKHMNFDLRFSYAKFISLNVVICDKLVI